MNAEPLVSIIIPVYNGARFLGEAIDSALAQTYGNIEIIVVDDGSDDKGATRAVAMGYGTRIRYVQKPNGGVSTALNLGIALMRGSFFSWLSHDDIYLPDRIASQIAVWRRFGRPCVVVSDWTLMEENGTPRPDVLPDLSHLDMTARPFEAFFHGAFNGCAMLIPRSVLSDNSFDPGLPRTQDNFLWFKLLGVIPFVRCKGIGVSNRMHPGQGSRDDVMLDEAGMCFVHALDRLTQETVFAYGGSEPAYFWKSMETLPDYPGIFPYVRHRVDGALQRHPFTLALICAAPASDLARQLARLDARRIRPQQVLVIDLGITGERGLVERMLAPWSDSTVAAPVSPTLSGFLETIASLACNGIVITATAVPEEDQIAEALKALLCTDARVARPRERKLAALSIDRHAFRRDADGSLAGLVEMVGSVPVKTGLVEYPLQEPERSPPPRRALLPPHGWDFTWEGDQLSLLDKWRDRMAADRPAILLITRMDSTIALSYLMRWIESAGRDPNKLVAVIESGDAPALSLFPAADKGVLRLRFPLPDSFAGLQQALLRVGVSVIQAHDVRGVEALVPILAGQLRVSFDMVVADHSMVPVDEAIHRSRRILTPSPALATLLRGRFPGTPVQCEPLTQRYPLEHRSVQPFVHRAGDPLRVLLIGDAGQAEGSGVIAEVVDIVNRRSLPIEFHALGDIAGLSGSGPLHCHPAVDGGGAWSAIGGIAPHLAWLPYREQRDWLWELDIAMWCMLPVCGSAIDAMVERCTGRRDTWLYAPDASAEFWVTVLLRRHAER